MNDGPFKTAIRSAFFRTNAVRTIRFGPLRGMKFRCSPITGLAAWYSGSERDHQEAFRSILGPGDAVIDIGANWGQHTLCFSRLVGPSGRVVAMEPFPPAYSELQWHVDANGCSNVCVVAAAACESNGFSEFRPGPSASTGALAQRPAQGDVPTDLFSVRTCTLDSIIEAMEIDRSLKLVKIDVEGAESSVLAGAIRTMNTVRPYFVIDLHTPEQDLRVAKQLIRSAYTLSRISGPPILNPDKGWPEPCGVWGSILATPTA